MPFWWDYVLAGIGAPDAPVSITCLQLWAQSEGMPAWEHNWLAVTQPGFGGHPVNPIGVMAYPSVQAGADATVAFMHGSNYDKVVYDFQHEASLAQLFADINQSKWCSGCQHGLYPIALYEFVSQNLTSPIVASGGTGGTPYVPPSVPNDGRITAQIGLNNANQYITQENPQHAGAMQWLASVLNTL